MVYTLRSPEFESAYMKTYRNPSELTCDYDFQTYQIRQKNYIAKYHAKTANTANCSWSLF